MREVKEGKFAKISAKIRVIAMFHMRVFEFIELCIEMP